MTSKIYSCSFTGLQCRIIEVQADISNGLSSFSIVGMGDISVQESKERIRSGIKNSGFVFPQTKKTINLAPAQVKKQGSLFDLPIAIGLLLASNQIKFDNFKDSIVIGELSLNGQVMAVNGVLPIVQYAKEQGFKNIFLPADNVLEASFIEGMNIFPLNSLREFTDFCFGSKEIKQSPFIKLNSFLNKTAKISTIINAKENIDKKIQKTVIIPSKCVNEIQRILSQEGMGEKLKVGVAQNQIAFKIGSITMSSLLIEGTFPNYEQVIPKKFDLQVKVKTKEALLAVRQISTIANDKTSSIRLSFGKGLLRFSSSQGNGSGEVEIDIDHTGQALDIAFNPVFVNDILKNIDEDEIVFELTGSLNPAVIRPVTDKNYICVIMPMKV